VPGATGKEAGKGGEDAPGAKSHLGIETGVDKIHLTGRGSRRKRVKLKEGGGEGSLDGPCHGCGVARVRNYLQRHGQLD